MKKIITLVAGAILISGSISFGQNSSLNSNNRPNSTNTGYLLDFKGTAPDNCPNLIPYNQYFIPASYTINSIGSDTLNVSTSGAQEGWHKLNIRLYSGNCVPTTVNLSNNQSLYIKVKSSVAVPQFVAMLADVNGAFANNNPPVQALTVGDNVISLSDLDFSIYGSPNKIDSTQIAFVSLHFRIADSDNDGGSGASPSVIGNFKVSQIHLGDVSSLLSGVHSQKIEHTLEVFPNPASDKLQVQFGSFGKATVRISDLSGKTLMTTDRSEGDQQIVFNTNSLTTGMYLLSITTEDGVVTRKVTIK